MQLFHILAKITGEPPGIPSLAHAGAHILNTPPLERRRAHAHLGDPTSREAVELSKQIAAGARAGYDPWYIQARLSVNSLDSFSLAITLAVAVASSFPLTISCLRQRHRHWFAVNTCVSPVSHFPHCSDGLAHKNSPVVDVPSSTCLDATDSSLVEAPHRFFTATAQIRFQCLLGQLPHLVLSLRLNAFLISIS